MTNRRTFLKAATAGVALAVPEFVSPARAQTSESRIDILLGEGGATIAPEIYGHFVEHLGGVVYDGIWVGERSSVPNIGGLRKQLVDALARVKPSVIRWPGGCFADQYDWHDGVGPREKRPKRTNFWVDSPEWPPSASKVGPQRYEPNEFGTIEFARFCKAVQAQPYFAANLRSLPAQDYWRWVEYCNSPAGSTTLAQQRAADGEREPLGVRYWGVGNESWGCGGNFTPEDYATEFRRFTAWVPSYETQLALVGSGPNDNNVEWTRRFFAKTAPGVLDRMWGWALHHYAWDVSSGQPHTWMTGKGDAVQFTPEQHYELLRDADSMESLILAHWAVMAESDPQHRVKLLVDEWGAWHKPGTEPFSEAVLGQQNTMRDAVLAGLTLDTFNRHADKIGMANVAQLVNCLQSLFFAHENKFCVTPTYHVFDLYSAHQGAKSVRAVFASPEVQYMRNGSPASIRGLNGSASITGQQLTLTVTNPSLDRASEAHVVVRGGTVKSAAAWMLNAADVRAHNSFGDPRAVEPKKADVEVNGKELTFRFPPASVTKLAITLG